MTRYILTTLVLALLAPAVTWAGADEPPPDMAWPQVGAVGVHRNYYDHLYLPARPTELPETLQVVILNDHDPRRNRIAWFRPCCARRVANDDLYFPGVEGQLAHVWRVRLESLGDDLITEWDTGIAVVDKEFLRREDGLVVVDLQGDGRPEIARGCVSREGVYIYLSESIDPIAEDPKPLWDFYWYLGYDTEPTCPWLQ
jgi:hypothetical protein